VVLQTSTYKKQSEQYQSLQPGAVTKARKRMLFSHGRARVRDQSELNDGVVPGRLRSRYREQLRQQAGEDANENE